MLSQSADPDELHRPPPFQYQVLETRERKAETGIVECVPAIVDAEEFEAVQMLLKSRSPAMIAPRIVSGRPSYRHLLLRRVWWSDDVRPGSRFPCRLLLQQCSSERRSAGAQRHRSTTRGAKADAGKEVGPLTILGAIIAGLRS